MIQALDVEFIDGLNIITGETGAGKSILLGALQLLMGARASTEVVRTGARKAVVEGVLEVGADPRVQEILNEASVDILPELLIRREVSSSHSRAFVNDSPVKLSVLKSLADCTIDLHGQHQHQSLLREDTHIAFVDQIGNYSTEQEDYRQNFFRVTELHRELAGLLGDKKRYEDRRELSEFQLSEIDALAMRPGEDSKLESEVEILDNAELLRTTTATVYSGLYESEGAIIDHLVDLKRELDSVSKYDPVLESLGKEIQSAVITLQEAASSINDYASRIEHDPNRLTKLRDRLGEFDRLRKKYGGTLEDVLAYAEELRSELETAANFDLKISEIRNQIDEETRSLGDKARTLSQRRRGAAKEISTQIVAALQELNIKKAVFDIRVEHDVDSEGWVVVESGDRVKAFENGIDRVSFHISMNPGEAVRPLTDVASGGEISRIMLALKSILARSGGIPLMVFDEIDVGISGKVAQQVGHKLRELASNHQVISITHLPQIAAMAGRHFVVEKIVEDNRTRSIIRQLTDDERPEYVASLASGSTITTAALESARELIDSASGN